MCSSFSNDWWVGFARPMAMLRERLNKRRQRALDIAGGGLQETGIGVAGRQSGWDAGFAEEGAGCADEEHRLAMTVVILEELDSVSGLRQHLYGAFTVGNDQRVP